MNKNIQSLAEDAGMDVHELIDGAEYCLVGKQAIEEFALSIIEDCMDQIIVDRYERSGNWDRALDNSVYNIKKRFGIR